MRREVKEYHAGRITPREFDALNPPRFAIDVETNDRPMVPTLNRFYGKLIERKDRTMHTYDSRTPVSITLMIGAAVTVGLASLSESDDEIRKAMTSAALDAYRDRYWGHPHSARWIHVANTIDAFVELRNQRDGLVLVQRADAELIASLNARIAEYESRYPTPADLGMTDDATETTETAGGASESSESEPEGSTDAAEESDAL